MSTSSNLKLEKGFKTWLETIWTQAVFYYKKKLGAESTFGDQQITMEEVEKVILNGEKKFSFLRPPGVYINSEEELKAKTEEKLEIKDIGEMSLFVSNSPEAYICFLCNKPMPADKANTTVYEGKNCHIKCFRKLKKGAKS